MTMTVTEAGESVGSSIGALIAPFDQLPDDFRALKEELHNIGVAGTPTLALLQARRALEWIFQDVYERRFREPTDKLELVEMIEQLTRKEQIPPLITANAGYVRSLGNFGGHPRKAKANAQAREISLEEVGSAVRLLVPIVEWYVQAHQAGELDRPAVTRDPKPPKIRLAIVPKGLHSFDEGDAPFFLKLLPGPFHADGLPESLHFWKERIEHEATFTVGVIYGRSGCGKSSLVKAGLLPHLADPVKKVYVEATADETEKNLLECLRKQFPKLPEGLDLKDTIEALRRRPAPGTKEKPPLEGKQKALVVLDQFEQWLHAHRGEKDTGLVRALRQCDGDRVQVLVMVRDDFWEAIAEFMEELHRPLKEGQNCRRVELFEQDHARQVLAAFGRAYGKLGEELTAEQEAFLDQAIQELAQGHRVICVRLALFAQMFQGKEWTPRALKEVGGTEGVGATFLEETFCSPWGDTQKYSNHKDGAIGILRALLPEEGAEIKGRKRSAAELLEASGYQNRPRDFAKLLGYLDSDLRLISPTAHQAPDPCADDPATAEPAARYYQLTHDYLVPSLRKWLTRKLQETRKGRASLLLNSRASMWSVRHEDRHMPTAREYLIIRTMTNPREWTPAQRTMMLHARNVHLRRAVVFAAALPVMVLGTLHIWGKEHAKGLVETLTSARIDEVPAAIDKLAGYRYWADPLLRATLRDGSEPTSRSRIHAALALLPVDPGQLGFLRDRLYDCDLGTFPTLRERLEPYRDELVRPLWRVLEDEQEPSPKRFRAACALADYTKDDRGATDARWAKSARFVAAMMTTTIIDDPRDYDLVLKILTPARRYLIPPLAAAFQDPRETHQTLRALILAEYAFDQPDRVAGLIAEARDPVEFQKLFACLTANGRRPTDRLIAQLNASALPTAKEEAALMTANSAVALLRMGEPDLVWPLFQLAEAPRVRSALIDRVSLMGVDPQVLLGRLAVETDEGIRQALILALGEYRNRLPGGEFDQQLPEPKRRPILARLEATYREASDPGVRGAAEWLLRTWGHEDRLARIDAALKRTDRARSRHPDERGWFVNGQGQTMVVIPAPGTFQIGARRDEPPDNEGKREPLRRVTIDSPFAIGAHEVTLAEFLRFRPKHPYQAEYLKPRGKLEPRCPVNNVTWFDAAEYCNWLSREEGIPEDQWCYEPNPETKAYASGMRTARGFLARTGYRLPTEAEWEYACRAGTITSRYYGESDELLPKYVWFQGNSSKKLWPVGSLKPNALGLFDTLGNAFEWCQDAYRPDPRRADQPDDPVVRDNEIRVMRGEMMLSLRDNIRAARRNMKKYPPQRDFVCGFRLARTCPAPPEGP